MKYGMVIDLRKCIGCNSCTIACKQLHGTPPGIFYSHVNIYEDGKYPDARQKSLPVLCNHCDDPACVDVCPVGASQKQPNGIVTVDPNKCIGCRYCMAACPYNARYFNWTTPSYPPEALAHTYSPEEPWPTPKGVVMKCMFCAHRAREGQLPECATGCPMGAIYFGNENEDAVTNGFGETLPFRKTLQNQGGFRWKEELGTDPRVYYLPARR